jgi:hypothetical protein
MVSPITWNEVFWYFTLIGLALAIIPIGLEHLQSILAVRLSKRGESIMHTLPKFFAAISLVALVIAMLVSFMLIGRFMDTITFYLQSFHIVSSEHAPNVSIVLVVIVLVLGALGLWQLWRWAAVRLPDVKTETERLDELITKVDSLASSITDLVNEIKQERNERNNPDH